MSESLLYYNLKKNCKCYIERIENSVCQGTPDVLIHLNGRPIFIELKRLKKKFKDKKLHFKHSQNRWFSKYPGEAYILFQVEDLYFLFNSNLFERMDTNFKISYCDFYNSSLIVSSDIKDIICYINDFDFNYDCKGKRPR